MGLLIDGNNVLGHGRGRHLKEPGAREQLVRGVAAYCRAARTTALIVFDGEPDGDGSGRTLGQVCVRFSGPGREADDVILEILRDSGDPAGTTVVTSDRSLADRAKWAGARTMRSDRFRQRLAAAPRGEGEGGAEGGALSKDEIAEWMKIFGEGDPPGD